MDQSESESVARAFVQYDYEHGPVVKRITIWIYNTNHYKEQVTFGVINSIR